MCIRSWVSTEGSWINDCKLWEQLQRSVCQLGEWVVVAGEDKVCGGGGCGCYVCGLVVGSR
jgi:hypothetical protein